MHRVERVPSSLGVAEEGAAPGTRDRVGGGTAAAAQTGPSGRQLPGRTTIGGGELLLPGEITLARDESYATPWVYLPPPGTAWTACPRSSTVTFTREVSGAALGELGLAIPVQRALTATVIQVEAL